MNVVSAWEEGGKVVLVERDGAEIRRRAVPARWALFVRGMDEEDREVLGRDPRVVRIQVEEGGETRIDCRDRWARKEIDELLTEAGHGSGDFAILEADVSPIRRLLSDVPSLDIDPDPRLVYLDIETDSRKSFASMVAGEARTLSWAIEYGGQLESAVLDEDEDEDERALLRALFSALDEAGDVVLAWNGAGFDFPVLEKRCEKLGLSIQFHRWCWLDHLAVYKKYNMHSDDGGEAKQSFKLDHVAHYLLGEGKADFDSAKTWEAWEAGGDERERLVEYNEKDTSLLSRIEEKTGFVSLHLAVCHICRVFPDTESLNATAQGDGFLIRLGAEYGYRWPTRRRFDEAPAKFAGAYVMEPTRLGAIDDVHVCDFAGLYPSIIRTWNMSPDTKLSGPNGASFQLPKRTTWFASDRDGMFRIALDRLVAKRAEYTAEMKRHAPGTAEHARFKRLSGAFKIVANSFYGILGSPWSRFFDAEIAEGVTQTGRWLLESVIEEARERGLDPFYGDTDSAFVAGDAKEMRALVDAMNASWSERLRPWGIRDRHHIDLDFEKTFRRIVIVSAKRYAGRYRTYKGKEAREDAKPEVKGLEFKRGDSIRLAREMQSEVVSALLADELPASASVRKIVERWKEKVLTDADVPLEDFVISQALSRPIDEYKQPTPPAHVRVAKILRERGEPIGEGARVSYVLFRGPKGKMSPIPVSDLESMGDLDRDYYWEHRIYPATERLLEKVYPDETWSESRATRARRSLESSGQATLGFGRPRRRKRRRVAVVTLGRDADRRTLEAVRAAAEAYPGDVLLEVVLPLDGARARVPTGLGVAPGPDCRAAMERLAAPGGVLGL